MRVVVKEVRRPHAFTIAGWVRAGSPAGSVLAAVVNLDRRDGLSLRGDRRVQFRLDAGRHRVVLVSPSPLVAGDQTHVAVVATSSSLALFVGGHEVAREPFEGARRPVAFRIMKRVYEKGRVYRRALSAEAIRDLAGPGAPPPPDVSSITPSSDAVRVPVSVQPSITFREPIDPSLVTPEAIALATADGTVVPAALSLDDARLTVRIVPALPLRPTRWHTVSAFGVTARFMTATEPQRVAAGESHSVALDTQGRVWTWGTNIHGQLGREGSPASPGVVPGLPPVTAVAAGASHTLALTADGRVFGWGQNTFGQVGTGDPAPAVTAPTEIPTLPEVTTIVGGPFGSAALDVAGHAWVWGIVQGFGGTLQQRSPMAVTGVDDVVAIASGAGHALVLRSDGTVWAWGGNGRGEVGDGTRTATTAPVQVAGLAHAAGVAAGSFSSFALMEDGSVQAWGLPSGAGTSQLLPAPLAGLSDVRALAADTNSYVAVTIDGGLLMGGAAPPVAIPEPAGAWQVSSKFERQLALTRQDELWTWTGTAAAVRVSAADMAWLSPRPILSHASGAYTTALQVKVTSPVTDAVTRYSTDGSDPGELHPQVANGGTVAIAANATLKVRAWEGGRLPSDVVEASYTFQPSTPAFSPAGGTYSSPRLVTISSSAGATIHYTVDGTQPDATSPVYTTPLHVATSRTIAAIALRPGWAASETAIHTYQLQLGVLPAPVISPASGTYESPVTVSISSMTGSTAFYTLDGSTPSPESAVYQGPFVVAARTTVRTRAIKADYEDSPTAEATYLFAAVTPVITPAEGMYSEAVMVQLSTATEGATIRYTLDGSQPGSSSPEYQEPIVLDAPATVRARAFHPTLEPSGTAATVFAFQAGATEAEPHGGIVAPGTQVVLAAVAGASVHFTLDGTTPTEASPVYVAPIGLPGGTVTLMARAFRTGWQPGPVLTAQFTVDADIHPPVVTASVSPAPV
ncbi:MAG: chitobiase/beta-hexosaminidase C-terminal domain-containing protein, partial [Vicinamibacterales bacterium]